jgi:hypothetical protein
MNAETGLGWLTCDCEVFYKWVRRHEVTPYPFRYRSEGYFCVVDFAVSPNPASEASTSAFAASI